MYYQGISTLTLILVQMQHFLECQELVDKTGGEERTFIYVMYIHIYVYGGLYGNIKSLSLGSIKSLSLSPIYF